MFCCQNYITLKINLSLSLSHFDNIIRYLNINLFREQIRVYPLKQMYKKTDFEIKVGVWGGEDKQAKRFPSF